MPRFRARTATSRRVSRQIPSSAKTRRAANSGSMMSVACAVAGTAAETRRASTRSVDARFVGRRIAGAASGREAPATALLSLEFARPRAAARRPATTRRSAADLRRAAIRRFAAGSCARAATCARAAAGARTVLVLGVTGRGAAGVVCRGAALRGAGAFGCGLGACFASGAGSDPGCSSSGHDPSRGSVAGVIVTRSGPTG